MSWRVLIKISATPRFPSSREFPLHFCGHATQSGGFDALETLLLFHLKVETPGEGASDRTNSTHLRQRQITGECPAPMLIKYSKFQLGKLGSGRASGILILLPTKFYGSALTSQSHCTRTSATLSSPLLGHFSSCRPIICSLRNNLGVEIYIFSHAI
jgi:hypothetical protein